MYKYQDSSLPIEERLEDLLSRMTIEEKIAQTKSNPMMMKMYYIKDNDIFLTEEAKKLLSDPGVGLLTCVTRSDSWEGFDDDNHMTPALAARLMNKMKKYSRENTRLGIPFIHGSPATHGCSSMDSCMFPVSLLMASTWNPEIYKKVCKAMALESRLQGNHIADAIILDLVMDPRWGRTEENYGEDPCIVAAMGTAGVQGLQNDNKFGPDAVVSVLKHFVGHGAPMGGHNRAPCLLPAREFHETYLRAWRAVVEAGALSIMPSYNEVDGIPNHANKKLLTDTIRNKWGFKGYFVADNDGIARLYDETRLCESYEDAQALAMNCGVDVDLRTELETYSDLYAAYQNGKVSEERITEAARAILYVKFALGLFEEEDIDPERTSKIVGCAAHREIAREAVRQGTILLKNKDEALPLRKDGLKIAVVGPNADSMYSLMGDYSPVQHYENVSTIYKGIRDKLASTDSVVKYAKGCGVRAYSEELQAEAVKLASESDVIIAVMGGSSWRKPEPGQQPDNDCGEMVDRADLNLFEPQQLLLKKLKETGKKLIVVLVNGRPISANWIQENADAVLEMWYPGWEAGNGLADILFGDCNPSGKLTITVPRSVGQLPIYYNSKDEMKKEYLDLTHEPLYPFGYGLSYTEFKYDNLRLVSDEIRMGEAAEIKVDVTNTGKYDGEEVVQLYTRDDYASTTRPTLELKAFEKVRIPKGETVTVSFRLHTDQLKIMDREMNEVTEPGTFTIMVGKNSKEFISAKLKVTE